jgi:hypothetical protein
LVATSQRLVWWPLPELALVDLPRLVAQVMVFGAWTDVGAVRAIPSVVRVSDRIAPLGSIG